MGTSRTQVEFSCEDDKAKGRASIGLTARIQKYHALAAPQLLPTPSTHRSGVHHAAVVGGSTALEEDSPVQDRARPPALEGHSFLLIPTREDGKRYGEQARKALPPLQLINVPGQADLMFCREQEELSLEDLGRLLRACRPAYDEVVNVPQSSPHARFDIQDWMPLDP